MDDAATVQRFVHWVVEGLEAYAVKLELERAAVEDFILQAIKEGLEDFTVKLELERAAVEIFIL